MGFFNKFKSKFEQVLDKSRRKVGDEPSRMKTVEVEREAEPRASVAPPTTGESTLAYRLLSSALVTEKSARLAGTGAYVFIVNPRATKLQVKQAVYELYGMRPRSIRMIDMEGKSVRFGGYGGKRKNWKKAIVSMPKGKTLPIYE